MKGNLLPAYAVYGLGVLLKPQMLIFTPVLLAGIWDHVFLQDFPGGNSSIICAVVWLSSAGCSFCALLSD